MTQVNSPMDSTDKYYFINRLLMILLLERRYSKGCPMIKKSGSDDGIPEKSKGTFRDRRSNFALRLNEGLESI